MESADTAGEDRAGIDDADLAAVAGGGVEPIGFRCDRCDYLDFGWPEAENHMAENPGHQCWPDGL